MHELNQAVYKTHCVILEPLLYPGYESDELFPEVHARLKK